MPAAKAPLALVAALLLLPVPLALSAEPGRGAYRPLAGGEDVGPLTMGMTACLTGDPPGAASYAMDFEEGAEGWVPFTSTPARPNLWHWTTFPGNGSANDALFHGGPGRLYYGIENAAGGTYNTSRMRNNGEMRSPALVVPGTVQAIAFTTKWHVEWDRAWLIDSMQVGYVNAQGQRVPLCFVGNAYAGATNPLIGYGYYQTSPVGQAVFTGCEWALESPQNPCRLVPTLTGQPIAFDLAPQLALWEPRWVLLPPGLGGQAIQLSFYFQTGDAIVDDAMGWMVDDVALVQLA